MPTPPLVAPVSAVSAVSPSPARASQSTPQPELRLARTPVAPVAPVGPVVNGTPQRLPLAQVYGGILLNGSLSVPTGSNGTMPAGTNGLFGPMRVPGSPAGGPFANGLAGSMRVPSPGPNMPNMAGSMPSLGTGAMIPLPGSMRVPSPERPEGAAMLFGSMRVPSPERHEGAGEVLSGSCGSCATPLWAAPANRGSPQPGRPAVTAPCAGYAVPTPFLPTKRPESPMMNHLRHLGTLNPSPEYQHLLNIVMTQEQAKQDLLERLEETERQLQQCRLENEMLRNGQNFRSNSVTSKTAMRSVAEGKEDSSIRTRSGSMRMRRSNSSRPRFTDSLVVPFSGKEALQDRFVVEWPTCLHVGTMNGLQSGETMTISRFFKGKSKSNSGQRIIKAVRKSQVPFFRLLEQHIGDQRSFDHPHVCRLIDAFEDEEHVYQVFEFLSGPSLLEKILSDSQFSERDAAAATKAILLAIGYLHGLSIAHQNVHLENMRFATHPRKKESGSCYCDQLKLMDLGLSLNRKLTPGILNAASQPATETGPATLPLLAPLGIQNSLGSVCLPPECQGVCSSYAQLATAAPCMLRRTESTQLHRSPSPTLQRKTSEDFGQTSSISSVGQESSSRRAKELLLLLQAGDVWSTGCILHILLSGQIPVTVVDSDKGGDVPKLPLLLGVSAGAIDTCAMLLHGMPRRRATAESALENNWFSQCEHIQKAHRSQKRNLSLAAPRSPEFFEKLRQTSAMTCLRRLFHSVRAVRNRTFLAIPGPAEDNKDSGTNARAAADAMCAEAFEWLLFSSGATSAGGIPLRKLNSMIQSVIQSESKVPRNDLEMRVDTLISSTQFAEMIWATCG